MRGSGLLSDPARLLLRAISHTGPEAATAFSQWRAIGPLDAAHGESHRVLPLLVELIQREGLDDPDLARMRGVAKQVWTHNVLRLRLLFSTLDALESRGIGAVLMKGAALFARTPALERRRVSADYDILVLPEDIPAAVSVLREGGFLPPGHAWEDFGAPLIDSVDAGVEIKRGNQRGLDLHWRPLWNIRDRELGKRYWRGAQDAELHGRAVKIPSATHQLFCAMARCEPWDRIECFTRVTEGYFLLSSAGGEVDWDEFAGLTQRYGLECVAEAYIGELHAHAGLALPPTVTSVINRSVSDDGKREWSLRAISPGRRSSSEHIALQRRDFAFGRSGSGIRPPGEVEERLRAATWPFPRMNALWQLARQRIADCPPGDGPIFLEGFSSPERDGRWTEGKWALVVMPLTEAQRQGEPLRLNAQAYRGNRAQVQIQAAGGQGNARCLLAGRETEADLSVRLRPLQELGGRGLLLLWLPDAEVPAEHGGSTDKRQLGLFIRRQWDRRTDGQAEVAGGSLIWLRRCWRLLPVPKSVRQRLSPLVALVAGLVRQVRLGRLPRPLALSAIGAGTVVFAAQLTDPGGVGRSGRLALEALRRWPATVIPHDPGHTPASQTIPPGEGGIWICHGYAADAAQVMLSGTGHIWARRYRIAVWAGDRPTGAWMQVAQLFHEIWVHSDAAAEMIRARCGSAGPAVRVVARPLPDAGSGVPRAFPQGRPFRFVTQVDMRSPAMRTAAIGAVRAFQSAFERTAGSASLVLSVVEAGVDPISLAELTRATAGWPNIVLVTKALTESQVLEMMAGADCLLALHSPEEMTQSIVEAMCCGTPVIAAEWPGSLASSTLVPLRHSPSAEPEQSAADAMLRLFNDPPLWSDLSRAGQATAAGWRGQSWLFPPCERYLA